MDVARRPEFGPPANFAQRLVAYVVDVILLNVATLVIQLAVPGGAGVIVSLSIFVAYFTLSEGSSGQTLGKRVVGIRVVDFERRTTIDLLRALVRTVGRWISGLVLLLGYLWMLWDRDRQTWHDKLASTAVVVVPKASDEVPT